MTDEECPTAASPCSRALFVACGLALLAGLCAVIVEELPRFERAAETGEWGSLLIDFNYNSTLPAIVFLLLPVCFFLRTHKTVPRDDTSEQKKPPRGVLLVLSLLCGGLSVLMSHSVAEQRVGPEGTVAFGDLPPAYHDEFSYLFQAQTYQAGKLAFPRHPTHPELFDQVHVLNEETFASRYFPVTGLIIAPFEASGNSYWGHWLCGGLTAVFMFWAGVELGGSRTGMIAGVMTALSPGLALFSNLLLAHHPTLLGLSLFLYCFLRMMRTRSGVSGVLAGIGLTFAMLARPMSAAGFALPMGVVLLAALIKPAKWAGDRKTAFKLNLAVGIPVLLGMLSLLPLNHAITGDALTTPYSLYTNTYTPRHVYGFDNAVRGDAVEHKQTLDKYDRWAENLTPAKARENVAKRLYASTVWTWGLVPLCMAGIWAIVIAVEPPWNRWTIVLCSLLTIHLVHVPYWFSGIMDWHYVFESALIWIVLLAQVTRAFWEQMAKRGRWGLNLWWLAMLAAPLIPMYFADGECWSASRMQIATREIAFSRLRYQRFENLLEQEIPNEQGLVLIHHDPSDIHIDHVTNSPALDERILRGRMDEGMPNEARIAELKAAFPDRQLWFFDAVDFSLTKL